MKNLQKYKVVLISAALVLGSFAYGYYLGQVKNPDSQNQIFDIKNSTSTITSVDLSPFWDVWKILDDKFVYTHKDAKVIDDKDKLWGAIQGLTSSYGDQYTVFFPPEENKAFQGDISGNFEGVGMELGIKNGNIVVVSPLKGSPAEKAGMKKGDQIIKIDDKATAGFSIEECVKLIRGKAGTAVKLLIVRDESKNPIEISIVRGVIDVPTTETEIKGDVFVIRLYNFYAVAPNKFREAIREFIDSGKTRLVLDLRGNPGGYLDGAVDMASFFLPMGKTVVRENYGPNVVEQVYRSRGFDVFNHDVLKMVILIDEGSASASEILAGALKEQGIAKLVGTRSFGKGSVQELIQITPETSLKVTVARWLTPNGNSISDGGLKPDVEVKFDEDLFKKGTDNQLEKAVNVVESL